MKIKRKTNINFNFGWFFLMILCWALVIYVIFRVNPESIRDVIIPNSYVAFFALLIYTLVVTIGVISKKWWRGLLWGMGAGLFILVNSWGLGTLINLLLIIGLIVSVEFSLKEVDNNKCL